MPADSTARPGAGPDRSQQLPLDRVHMPYSLLVGLHSTLDLGSFCLFISSSREGAPRYLETLQVHCANRSNNCRIDDGRARSGTWDGHDQTRIS